MDTQRFVSQEQFGEFVKRFDDFREDIKAEVVQMRQWFFWLMGGLVLSLLGSITTLLAILLK